MGAANSHRHCQAETISGKRNEAIVHSMLYYLHRLLHAQ